MRKRLLPLLAPLLPCLFLGTVQAQTATSAARPAIKEPRGIFADAGSMDPEIVNHPQVKGVLIRVAWSRIEPNPGAFDFSPIERQIAPVKAAHKLWSLAVMAGPRSPAWLYASPYSIEALNINFRGNPVHVPKFWSTPLQERMSILATALAGAFKDDPSLALVYLPQMSANGIEGHFNGNPNATLTTQGFTEDLWVHAVLQSTRTFAAAFPQKPIAIELHDILGSASAARRIMRAIEDDPALINQAGVGIWWLSGRTDYQADLLADLSTFKSKLYAQVIARSSRASAFPSNDYTQAFQQARKLGIRYLEPWDVDVKSHQWDAVLEDFNNYAQAH